MIKSISDESHRLNVGGSSPTHDTSCDKEDVCGGDGRNLSYCDRDTRSLQDSVQDIYVITSVFFTKGVIDGQKIYNQDVIDEISSEKDLILFIEDKPIKLPTKEYLQFVISEMSKRKLLELRASLVYFKNSKFRRELCVLLDYLYKLGISESHSFDGLNMITVLQNIKNTTSEFFSPDGFVNTVTWNDLIRKYLVLLRVNKRIWSNELAGYLANQALNKQLIEEQKLLDDARKNFILSGGDVPAKYVSK